MAVSERAGQPAQAQDLVDVPRLVTAYYAEHPDPGEPGQRVSFGTSGHRGSSLHAAFNDDHIAATTQAIVEYRAGQGITGPLYIGKDTHALSLPAWKTAIEVLVANGVTVLTEAERRLADWRLRPNGSEGFAKAEVTVGGVATGELSSKTMEARGVPGLHAIGEAVDVTGWLGGYNFQWAWASGTVAGRAAAARVRRAAPAPVSR